MQFDLVDDVSRRNDILVVSGLERPYSAGVWTTPVEDSLKRAGVECLNYAIGALQATWPDWGAMADRGALPGATRQPDHEVLRFVEVARKRSRQESHVESSGTKGTKTL